MVLNYNGGEHVLRALEALEATEWAGDRFEIVVVDNASTDGSPAAIEARFPGVELRRSPTNVGFPANNLALSDLDAVDFVALVNNDAFVEPGWLEPLVAALEADAELGAACPRIVFAASFAVVELTAPELRPGRGDGRVLGVRLHGARADGEDLLDRVAGAGVFGLERDAQGEPFRWTASRGPVALPVDPVAGPWKVDLDVAAAQPGPVSVRVADRHEMAELGTGDRCRLSVVVDGPAVDVVNNVGSVVLGDGSGADRGFQQVDGATFDEPTDVFAWCGAAVLLRPRYLADVGLFDERFFMYYEDTDLSWRGHAAGWRYRYVPDSRVRHLHAATAVEGSPLFRHFVERNRLLMLAKNGSRRLALRAPLRFLLATASYARRDVVGRLARGRRPDVTIVAARLRSFGGYLRLLPAMLRDRRLIRSHAVATPNEIEAGLVDSARVGP